MLLYQHRAELNQEFYLLQKFFGKLEEFKFMIFSVEIEEGDNEEDSQYVGFVKDIKNHVKKLMGGLEKKLDTDMRPIKQMITKNSIENNHKVKSITE